MQGWVWKNVFRKTCSRKKEKRIQMSWVSSMTCVRIEEASIVVAGVVSLMFIVYQFHLERLRGLYSDHILRSWTWLIKSILARPYSLPMIGLESWLKTAMVLSDMRGWEKGSQCGTMRHFLGDFQEIVCGTEGVSCCVCDGGSTKPRMLWQASYDSKEER